MSGEEPPVDFDDIFVDGTFRAAARGAALQFQQMGYLPDNFSAQTTDFRHAQIDGETHDYSVIWQPRDSRPFLRAGIAINKGQHHHSYAGLQTALFTKDKFLPMITLTRTIAAPRSPQRFEQIALSVQLLNQRSEAITSFEYTQDLPTDSHRIRYATLTPFGWQQSFDRQSFNGQPIPEISPWPEYAVRQSAIRLLDEPRLIHMFQMWSTELSNDWASVTAEQALDNISLQIIQPPPAAGA